VTISVELRTTLTALVEHDVDELSFYCWALDVAPPAPKAEEKKQ
jgi:hypothetical protein